MKRWIETGGMIAVLAAGIGFAQAQSPVKCHTSTGYMVVEREREDFNGMDFLAKKVSPNARIACAYAVAEGDFEIDVSDDAFLFWGLADRFLVLNRGMSAMRTLVVYDLEQRKPIFEAATSGKDVTVAGEGVTFWLYSGEGTPKTCKQYREYSKSGLMPVVETRATFDFASQELRKSTQTRCSLTQ